MNVRLFLLSDIHAFDGAKLRLESEAERKTIQAPSYFDITLSDSEGGDNPIRDIKKLIDSKSLTSEYLICCGDLADKAVPQAAARAWREIQEIGKMLETKEVIVTVGNHDVDSRYQHNDFDAKGVLLDLDPGFPFADEKRNCHFWTHHYVVFPHSEQVRFVVLNSSAYHGNNKENKEYEHGRISARTLNRLKTELLKGGKFQVNILICHHHPQKHEELGLGSFDDMEKGSEMLAMLSDPLLGPWIVFHGHKHHPKITYASGGTNAPVVFSLGSCAAVLGPHLTGHARNQLYYVEIPVPTSPTTVCKGVFKSWAWAPGLGWQESQYGSGLPSIGGFGLRCDLGQLASEVSTAFPNGDRWGAITSKFDEIKYLLPCDLKMLVEMLKTSFGYRIEPGLDGTPCIIEK